MHVEDQIDLEDRSDLEKEAAAGFPIVLMDEEEDSEENDEGEESEEEIESDEEAEGGEEDGDEQEDQA
ncbi:MAG: hypothetical protein R2791_17090 [Saprospiraceae bacterium]